MDKTWKFLNKLPDKKNEVDDIIRLLLDNRGLKTKKEINEFLNPTPPYLLSFTSLGIKKKAMGQAIKRIKQAIATKEKIIIYGDYDADGICATALMWETLNALGARVMPFIPNREDHGYGLNQKGIDQILKTSEPENQPSLIITVDNGIVAHQGVEYCRQKGIEVIISDHHQIGKPLPSGLAIVHSDQISGAGVAWFLAKEIYGQYHQELKGFKASNSLELACLGTVTDMMPMNNTNRRLVKHGLEEIRRSSRLGIRALCAEAGVPQKEIDTYHLGYILGPRLNAMGRLDDALDSLRLLCTKNEKRAQKLAAKLGLTNRQRRQLTEETFNHARKLSILNLKSRTKRASKLKLIFISHQSYNPGVIGLVAGRLVEEFYRPAIVIAEEDGYAKGSARSIKGFDIIRALRKLKEIFLDIGGHPMAAGFTIESSKLKKLEKEIKKLSQQEIKDNLLQPKINIDLEISLENISWPLLKAVERFGPFGLGNPRPCFVLAEAEIFNVRTVGREQKHLKLMIKDKERSRVLEAIGFNFGSLASKISSQERVDICFNLEANTWNNEKKLELKIKDIK